MTYNLVSSEAHGSTELLIIMAIHNIIMLIQMLAIFIQCRACDHASRVKCCLEALIAYLPNPLFRVPEEKMREILQAAIKCITEEFLQAEHYGLLPRPT